MLLADPPSRNVTVVVVSEEKRNKSFRRRISFQLRPLRLPTNSEVIQVLCRSIVVVVSSTLSIVFFVFVVVVSSILSIVVFVVETFFVKKVDAMSSVPSSSSMTIQITYCKAVSGDHSIKPRPLVIYLQRLLILP